LNLVTGATGIIGSHVVLKLLQDNKPVIACKQKNSDLRKVEKLYTFYGQKHLFEKITWKEVDVCEVFSIEEALEGISTVYNCAGFVSFNKKDRKKLFRINETGTSNVITACFEKKIQALCHVSSIATLNNLDHKEPLHENVFWKTNGKESDYALSKYNAEREVWRAMEEGLNAVIVNPGLVLSPGFWDQSSSRLFDTCSRGNMFYTSGSAGYISAKDTAAIMIELTEKKHFANRYILVENNYSFKNILDLVSVNLGKSKTSIKANRFILQSGRFCDFFRSKLTGKEQVLTKAVINSALNNQTYLNTKVKEALGYNFMPIEAEIIEICRFFGADRRV